MKSYSKSKMDSFSEHHINLDAECTVQIDADHIKIKYKQDGEHYSYTGSSIGPGHYNLHCDGYPECRATLHCFEDSKVLEGSWREEQSQGMWRIRLIGEN